MVQQCLLLFFIKWKQHEPLIWCAPRAYRACWLCTALLPYPATPSFSSHTPLCLHAISPQAWNGTAPTIWRGLQIADSLWKSPVSPSTETDLWTTLLGPGVCICFASCKYVWYDSHVAGHFTAIQNHFKSIFVWYGTVLIWLKVVGNSVHLYEVN